jgi:hypothetical protein
MQRFSKQIAVGNETRLFEFTRLQNFNGVKFFITSVDENKKPFLETGAGIAALAI